MNPLEIIIALGLLLSALFLFYRSLRSKSEGVCSCDTCAAKCPTRDSSKGCGEILFLDKKTTV